MSILLRWKRQWGGADRIVWVIVRKLEVSWSRESDGYYLPPFRRDYKYERFGEWVLANAASTKIEMPHVGFYEGIISFTDGRHRFAWCRDHGVRAMPVTVCSKKEVLEVKRAMGSRAARCLLPSQRRKPI